MQLIRRVARYASGNRCVIRSQLGFIAPPNSTVKLVRPGFGPAAELPPP